MSIEIFIGLPHLNEGPILARARLTARPIQRPHCGSLEPETPRTEPWEAAISQARKEIRDLIEAGELDHDELTASWIEQGPPTYTASG